MPDLGNSSVFNQADASNASGTMPSWSGAAAPSTLDDAGRALQGAVTREWNWRSYTLTATGTSDAKVLTYSVAPAAYYNGQRFAFIANTTNTTSATLNVNSLGAKTIKKVIAGVLTNLSSGDMVSGAFVEVAYNTANDCFVWTGDSATPYFSSIELGNTSDTTITRSAAGVIAVEGGVVPKEDRVNTFSANQTFSGKVGIGTAATGSKVTISDATLADITILGDSSTQIQMQRASTDATGPLLQSYKARGTTASRATVVSGDIMGRYQFFGHDGTSFVQAAEIRATVDTTPGTNDMPGRLTFHTTPDGAAAPVEVMRIDNAGNVGIGPSGTNRINLSYNSASGVATVGPNSTSGSTTLQLGTSNSGTYADRLTIDSSGNILNVSSGGLGYGTGSGGTVTQATSKSTTVTLNKTNGQITMNAAALASGTDIQFIFNNSTIAATDNVVVTANFSGAVYKVNVYSVSAGSCSINVRQDSGGSRSDAVVINFAVIKAVTA